MSKETITAPTGSLVTIGTTAYGRLTDDLSINLSSHFQDLISWRPPALFSAIAATISNNTPLTIPGSAAQFGLQIWASTDPVSVSFEIILYIGMTLQEIVSESDMVAKAKFLMKLPVPRQDSNTAPIGLIPPGPDLTALFKNGNSNSVTGANTKNVYDIKFGNGILLKNAVVTSVKPTVSRFATNTRIPIYLKLSIEAQGIFTANDSDITGWFG